MSVDLNLRDARTGTVRDRLIEAADEELAEYGTLTGRFEAVAHRAGVSRATAYRQLGSISELSTQVGLRRAQKYVRGMREVMNRVDGALAKIEEVMVYAARELPNDPVVLDLISPPFAAIDPEVRRLIIEVLWSPLAAGRRAGAVRTDIGVEVLIDYLTEQSYLTTHGRDRSERAVRQRFRLFIAPAVASTA